MSKIKLPIDDLASRHSGLTEKIAQYYLEAARVCLDRHHKTPSEFVINGAEDNLKVDVEWKETNRQIKSAWANEIDTTEAGACACTIAAVELSKDLIAVRRAETKTGADYYVAPKGKKVEDLEECFRLEISGMNKCDSGGVARRLSSKIDQVIAGRGNFPAMAGVVGFQAKLIMLKVINQS